MNFIDLLHFIDISKANPYHDAKGRFASGSTSKLPIAPAEGYDYTHRLDFKDRLEAGWQSIPEKARSILLKSGMKIKVGSYMTDIDKSLKGVTPRGWPTGSTWDECDGFATFERKGTYIAIAEKTREAYVSKPSNRAQVIITHESAHVLDGVDKINKLKVSSSKAFKEAYQSDISTMNKADKAQYAYNLQEGRAGREETFATVFSRLSLSNSHLPNNREVHWEEGFPNVAKFIKERYFNVNA